MAKIIVFPVRRSRLPRRLTNDGWWLETPPPHSPVIAFAESNLPKPKPKGRHLTLVTPGK